MSDIFPGLPTTDIDAVVRSIDTLGYGVIKNGLSEAVLVRTRQFVEDRVRANHGEYLHFTGAEAVAGTLLQGLSESENFQNVCRTIYERGVSPSPPPPRFHMVLRCLAGASGQRHAYYFHYDSYVLTALAPVIIPTEGRTGDLILFPNVRRIRRHYVTNLFDKICLDNPVTQWALRTAVRAGWLKPVRLKMEPGNIYLFWGYRTLHTNEPCDVDKIRSTALMHYADPHAHSWLRQKLGRA
ncbi:hypothetical protein Q1W73_08000 [Asticcacaulis sp. ZE23SCel15]|uniref:hypothetical protein n=1 Tax=Asticcacaulis sp. ZE23SCel15 TaxID=3059027 RepID=UPI002660276A|nr:hypothetical protein [Asticcacaulis sp. ZE23SCel15]WKL58918.1 hypothetical protein Q1W73_08000 [Asticcacaulis sp. ZE23SCel15]